MKLSIKFISLLCIMTMTLCSGFAVAVDDPPYMLTRVGSLTVGGKQPNEQQMLGVVVGLRLNFSFYVEGEFNLNVGGGNYARELERETMSISTMAIYGAYRNVLSPNYYLKAKAGVVYQDMTRVDNNTQKEISVHGSDGSGGLGLGIVYHLNKKPVMIELEATSIEQHILLYTVGMTYPF
jgi:hypothetical protein